MKLTLPEVFMWTMIGITFLVYLFMAINYWLNPVPF